MAVTKKRLSFIDLTRGMLIILMANTHTITQVSEKTSIRPAIDLLPSGWATELFIILSGFTVGFLLKPNDGTDRTGYLLRRGREIFLVMLISNILFSVLAAVVQGQSHSLADPAWWFGFFTLETPYTISAILIPTAILLALSPLLFRLATLSSEALLLLISLFILYAAHMATAWLKAHPDAFPLLTLFAEPGVIPFSLIPIFAGGLFGFALGVFMTTRRQGGIGICVSLFTVFLLAQAVPAVKTFSLIRPLMPLGAFSLLLGLGLLASHAAKDLLLSRVLIMLGKYGLLMFLLHRVVLQALKTLLPLSLFPNSEAIYLVMMGGLVVILYAVGVVRAQNPGVDRAFKKIYI